VAKLEIVLASRNKGKLTEIQDVLKDLPIDLLTLQDVHFEDRIEEIEETFKGNAVLKATTVAQKNREVDFSR